MDQHSPGTGSGSALHGMQGLSGANTDGLPFQAVFDNMFEGVQILDADWSYVYLNDAAVQHARKDRSALLGRRITDMYPGFEQTDVFAVMERCLDKDVSSNIENRFIYPDGHVAWFDLRINPIPGGLVVLSIDISDRKKVEFELRHSKESLGTTLECISQAVIATDTQGLVRRMNQAAEDLVGRTWFEAEGKPVRDLVRLQNAGTGDSLDFWAESITQDAFRLTVADNVHLVAQNGNEIPVSGTGATIKDEAGTLLGGVLVLRNIKDDLELLQMFHHAQKMEAVGQLAGGVAHDYNNMLTIILGYCEMLLGSLDGSDPVRQPVQKIHKAGKKAADLTRRLLAFSRKQITEAKVFNPNEVIEQLEPLLRGVISEDIQIEIHTDPNLESIFFDTENLEQILMNLAINARDAMPEGGCLAIKTSNVELDAEYARTHARVEAGNFVMVAVSDTGIGMSREIRSRIFEPFFTTKDKGKGTGLGLPMVYGLVKQVGGHIWVYSEPGLGTTFKLYFPVAAGKEGGSSSDDVHSDHRFMGTETILVVEDDEDVRNLVCTSLAANGFNVLEAGDAESALEICLIHAEPIHLLVSDVVMPDMSGPKLGRKIHELRPDILMLFMSGYLGESVVREDLLDEGDAFIEKPFTPNSLVAAIRDLLD